MTICFLGAGFPYVCGLPLAKDLFDSRTRLYSKKQYHKFKLVWDAYDNWRKCNSHKHVEEFLYELYSSIFIHYAKYEYAVEVIAAVLATPVGREYEYYSPRYKYRITSPLNCSLHTYFWQNLLNHFDDISIITTNYDLTIEKCLRHTKMKRVFSTGFTYGGFKVPQSLKGVAQPFTIKDQQKEIILKDGLNIYKLHGSLNWSREINNSISMFIDMRPAYRNNCDAAIVPPLPEKMVPNWLINVWKEAENQLIHSEDWIICGYSFPDYDIAINEMFRRTAKSKNIFVLDPNSKSIVEKLKNMIPNNSIYAFNGLPEGIEELINC